MASMFLADTHSHIYLPEFDADRSEMLLRAEKQGVKKILMPAIDSSTEEAMLAVEKDHPQTCLAMMGLHPCSVKKESYQQELEKVRENLEKRRFIAIGETGLDFYWDKTFVEQQYESFEQQVKWAREYDLPVVIHSRESTDECIEVIKKYQDGKLKGVFHCFSGNAEQAKKIMDLDFYLGIGGVVTFKNSGLDKVIEVVGMKNVVLETDAPYLAPVPFRGKRNEPSYLEHIVNKLVSITNSNADEIASVTNSNAIQLFGDQLC